jgi:hypothetical protein
MRLHEVTRRRCQVNVGRSTSRRIDRFTTCERSRLVPAATERFRIRAMPQAISEHRVCFASKASKMFIPQVHAT